MPPKPRHSKLSPSASERWLNCPGSVKLCETIPEEPSSSYADEGTAAHELAEGCLRTDGQPAQLVGMPTKVGVPVTEEMAEHVQLYVDAVRAAVAGSGTGNALAIEVEVKVWDVHEECGGTADAVVVDLAHGTLWVFDLKFGRGVLVSAIDNSQIRIYALGAYYALDEVTRSRITNVRMVIVQPRRSFKGSDGEEQPVRVSEITTFDLLTWRDTVLRPGVDATQAAEPEFRPSEGACRWCPASKVCTALRDRGFEAAAEVFALPAVVGVREPDSAPLGEQTIRTLGFGRMASALTPERLGEALRLAPILEHWIAVIRKHAEARLHHGTPVTGWKLVEGKLGNRKWVADDSTIAAHLHAAGLSPQQIYKPAAVVSPATAEKLLEKDKKPTVDALTSRSPGARVMVPENDKRPAIRPDAGAVFRDGSSPTNQPSPS